MKNISNLGNTGMMMTNDHLETRVMQNPPNQPQREIPLKPDTNPDPTRLRPGVNDPEKIDPTRIQEPAPADPTRINNPPPMKPDQEPRKHLTIW